MNKSIAVLLLSILLCISPLSKSEELRLGSPYFPPYVYFDIDGELTGLWMTQLAPALEEAGITYNAIHIPIRRFYVSAATGKIDLFAMPRGRAGMENVLFSEKPFSHFDLRAFWLDDANAISSLSELAGRKVVLIKGYSYGGKLEAEISAEQRSQFVVANDQKIALKMLVDKEVDFVLGYWAIMAFLQKNSPDLQINNIKIAELPIYLAMHENAENAEQLMQKFNDAVR